ncbi:MAG: hypothetical protein IPM29_27165 [Planctomycetes bacterium]|nr:hypothetical protein [Planctomycetota bacterium]
MIAAVDFSTVEASTVRGLVISYVPIVIGHATRAFEVGGIATDPYDAFMVHIARNLTDCPCRRPPPREADPDPRSRHEVQQPLRAHPDRRPCATGDDLT